MMKTEQGSAVTIRVPLKLARRGGRKVVSALPGQMPWAPKPRIDDALLHAVVRAFFWKRQLDEGAFVTVSELAHAEKLNTSFVAHQLRLTLLAPFVVEAIVSGRQSKAMQLQALVKSLPEDWQAQERLF